MREAGLVRRALHLVAATTLAALASCGDEIVHVPQGQILLHFDTDAPLPAGIGDPARIAPPLFDRLRVEIYAPGATAPCDACSNDFEITRELFAGGQASLGVVLPLNAPGYVARARMFKKAFTSPSGEPNADSTVDVTVALPSVRASTIADLTVFLSTDDAGRAVGSRDAPAAPIAGAPQGSRVGTWSGATPAACKGSPPPGAVCVPGGAYWMGDPNPPGFAPQSYAPEPRLVVLSPFFLSSAEITVAEYRAAGLTPREVWSGSYAGSATQDFCTFTASPSDLDAMPVNCVTRDGARAYCVARGGDLPSEAQFEYAAGGLAGNRFPWGRDEPQCTDAVFGRAGWGVLQLLADPCRPAAPPGAPAVAGTGTRDRLELPGGTIADLAGNMTEWVRDAWNRIGEGCWANAGVYRDPICTTPSPTDGDLAVRRGGNWVEASAQMTAQLRFKIHPESETIQSGFRCAWASE